MKNNNWGGARDGSGKKKGTIEVSADDRRINKSIRLPTSLVHDITKELDRLKMTFTDFIEKAAINELKKSKRSL